MPKFNGFTWQDFKVSIMPSGKRGTLYKLSHRHFTIPYFSDSDVNILAIIETISGEKKEFSYSWSCHHKSSEGIATAIATGGETFLGKPRNRADSELKIPWISFSGKYAMELEVCYPITPENKSGKSKIGDFFIIETDPFIIKVLFAIVGVIGIAIGAILGWLLSC